jgi:peptidoglycan/xylan/chitin deacetylase (PgdA/CDA1 family)
VGSQVLNFPDILKQAYQEGHEIALHTWSHTNLPSLTDDQIVAELVWNMKIIQGDVACG